MLQSLAIALITELNEKRVFILSGVGTFSVKSSPARDGYTMKVGGAWRAVKLSTSSSFSFSSSSSPPSSSNSEVPESPPPLIPDHAPGSKAAPRGRGGPRPFHVSPWSKTGPRPHVSPWSKTGPHPYAPAFQGGSLRSRGRGQGNGAYESAAVFGHVSLFMCV
eukprot:5970794-Pyramimonas_sp.AAC.1